MNCETCGKRYQTLRGLRRHIYIRHPNRWTPNLEVEFDTVPGACHLCGLVDDRMRQPCQYCRLELAGLLLSPEVPADVWVSNAAPVIRAALYDHPVMVYARKRRGELCDNAPPQY